MMMRTLVILFALLLVAGSVRAQQASLQDLVERAAKTTLDRFADKKLQELVKAADAAKKEWAEELKKAAEAAKEKKIKVWFASLSVPLEVVAVPVTLKTAADAVTIKAGEKAELPVDVVREFGFADEVKLEMSGGNAPVKVAALTAAGNQAQVPLVLTTEKTAKPGTYTVTLRGSLKFNAKALTVDKTLQVTIEPPAGQ